MKEKARHLVHLLLGNFQVIETAIIMLSVWWCFILALPMDTFGSSPSYSAMAQIANEYVWALAFFVAAAFNLYGMIFDKRRIRVVGLLISTWLWIFIAAMMAVSNIATTGTGTYFVIFCLNAYVVYKVGEKYGRI